MPDRFASLLDAARRVQETIAPGTQPGVVTLTDAAGGILFTARLPAPPAPGGWAFSPDGFPCYRGKTMPVRGQPLLVLEMLAAVEHSLTVADLRPAWAGYEVSDSTVRWTVGELRKTLRSLFPDCPEPVESGPDGYRLAVR